MLTICLGNVELILAITYLPSLATFCEILMGEQYTGYRFVRFHLFLYNLNQK